MEKTFKTIDEQIEILKKRKLKLNEKNAKEIFRNNNYYYLINGYKDIFIDKKVSDEIYKANVRLEEIYALYNFDSELRNTLLKYILKIERKMDSYVAYEFSRQYGHKKYLSYNNFDTNKFSDVKIESFINEINSNINRQVRLGNKMLKHYINKYGYIPLWVLIRIMTFGQVSNFYHMMKQREQNKIAKNFGVKEKDLKTYIYNLSIIRNICAHDEKVYDIKFMRAISENYIHRKMDLLYNKDFGFKDLFSIIIILKLLLSNKEFNEFYSIIIKYTQKLRSNITSIDFKIILNKMGFPNNYIELLIIKDNTY